MLLELLAPIIVLFVALFTTGFMMHNSATRFHRDYLADAKAAFNLKKAGFIDDLKSTVLDVLERAKGGDDELDPGKIEMELWNEKYEKRIKELNAKLEKSEEPMDLFHIAWEEKRKFGSKMIGFAVIVALHSILVVFDVEALLSLLPMVFIIDLFVLLLLGGFLYDHYKRYSESEEKFFTLLEKDFEAL